MPPPREALAVLLATVLLFALNWAGVRAEPSFAIPPPVPKIPVAELKATVLLFSVSVPEFEMPPPTPPLLAIELDALFSLMVLSLTVITPPFEMPPPPLTHPNRQPNGTVDVFPLIVLFFIVNVPPL